MRNRKKFRLTVIERPMKTALGLAEQERRSHRVTIHPNQGERSRLNTLVHECLHLGDWSYGRKKDLSETHIDRMASKVARVLWSQGYRRIIK